VDAVLDRVEVPADVLSLGDAVHHRRHADCQVRGDGSPFAGTSVLSLILHGSS
jgi:hypothetical protein